MTLFDANGRLFYFSHIPKTGGSTVEHAFRQAGAKRALHFHRRLDYVKCTMQHMHAELFDIFVPPAFYERGFTVVRHPFARLLSEFRWRSDQGNVQAPDFGSWVEIQIDRYQTNPYILDNHLRPQVEFIGQKIEVFRFEQGMPSVLGALSDLTGLALDPSTHRRKSGTRDPAVWSARARQVAIDMYRRDFDTFGYDPEQPVDGLSIV